MKKGTATRMAILRTALDMATIEGLNQLTIGKLANAREMSKSGVYAHFRSKEKLQLEVIQYAQLMFNERVTKPCRNITSPLARLIATLENWFHWHQRFSGGCFFVGAVSDFDHLAGAVHEELKIQQQVWQDHIKQTLRQAISENELNENTDTELLTFQLNACYLGAHWQQWLEDEDKAWDKYQQAIQQLLSPLLPTPKEIKA